MSDFREGFRDGSVAVLPVLPSMLPFATIVGVAAVEAGLSPEAAMGMSMMIFAGAAQLALIQLFDAGAALPVMLLTALVINLRFAMYSASLAPVFHGVPLGRRLAMGYLMTDQNFALCVARCGPNTAMGWRVGFYVAIGGAICVVWQIGTLVGALLGAQVPPSWSLDFAIPLMFLGLLLMGLRQAPQLIAALVGGSIAVYGHDWPYNSGLMVGAVSGVLSGWLSQRWLPAPAAEGAR